MTLVAWQFLVDPYPAVRLGTATGADRESARPAGLYVAGAGGNVELARPKPFLTGFRFPFDPLRVGSDAVRVWALCAQAHATVRLEWLRARGWRTIAQLHAGASGVLNALVPLAGDALLRLRSGTLVSAPTPVTSLAAAGAGG